MFSIILRKLLILFCLAAGMAFPLAASDREAQDLEQEQRPSQPLPPLPDELWVHIFSWLPCQALLKAGGTCKQWQQLTDEPLLWRDPAQMIRRDYEPQDIATIDDKTLCKQHLRRIYVHTLSDPDKIIKLIDEHQLNTYRSKMHSLVEMFVHQGKALSVEDLEILAAQENSRAIYGLVYAAAKEDQRKAQAVNDFFIKRGHAGAIKIKGEQLERGGEVYSKDVRAAKQFLHERAKKGDLWAMDTLVANYIMKRYDLESMDYELGRIESEQEQRDVEGYLSTLKEKGYKSSVVLLELASRFGDYALEKDKVPVLLSISCLAKLGNDVAMEDLIWGPYGKGSWFDPPTDNAISVLHDIWKTHDGPEREKLLRHPSLYGLSASEQEVLVAEVQSCRAEDFQAQMRFMDQVFERLLLRIVHSTLEDCVAKGFECAVGAKLRGLAEGKYGYRQDRKEYARLLDYYIGQGCEEAISLKLNELNKISLSAVGNAAKSAALRASQAFLNEMINQRSSKAIDQALGYFKKITGHTARPLSPAMKKIMRTLLDNLTAQAVPIAIHTRLLPTLQRQLDYSSEDTVCFVAGLNYEQLEAYIRSQLKLYKTYEVDTSDVKECLETFHQKGFRLASYAVAFGLRYGFFGFERNPQAAIDFIRAHSIAF